MKSILLWVGICCLLGACAGTQITPDVLVPSLRVGVDNQTFIARKIANKVFPQAGQYSQGPNSLEYVDRGELDRGLKTGNYDLAIGLIDHASTHNSSYSLPLVIEEFSLRFFLLPSKSEIAELAQGAKFYAGLKSLGYVSTGELGDLNRAMIEQHPEAFRYSPCGSLSQCIDALQNQVIDAFATSGLSSSHSFQSALVEQGIQLKRARYWENRAFGLKLNRNSLDQYEINALANMVKQALVRDAANVNSGRADVIVGTIPLGTIPLGTAPRGTMPWGAMPRGTKP